MNLFKKINKSKRQNSVKRHKSVRVIKDQTLLKLYMKHFNNYIVVSVLTNNTNFVD